MTNTKNNDSRKLTKKDVSTAAWRWMFFHHCAQNYERMQGAAYAHTLSGGLEKLYGDDKKGLSEALTRNLVFFNTEPQIGSIVPGISLALEEDYALNPDNNDTEIMASTKNALMGPLAGIGDSLLVGTLNPILLSIGIGMSEGGSPIGAIFFLVSWLAIVVPMKYFLFIKGYDLGLDAVKLISNERLKNMITSSLTIVGLIVIGGVASMTVKAPIKLAFQSGKMTISIQEIFDKIMPSLLPLIVTLVSYKLINKRKWSANKVLVGILVFAALMVALKVM
jgi:PTS system mannose-specific IID component